MDSKTTNLNINPEDLKTILNSFGRMIDIHKYLGNACEVQSNISDGTFSNFNLSEYVCSIVQFLCNNSSINDTNKLANMYVDSQPKLV